MASIRSPRSAGVKATTVGTRSGSSSRGATLVPTRPSRRESGSRPVLGVSYRGSGQDLSHTRLDAARPNTAASRTTRSAEIRAAQAIADRAALEAASSTLRSSVSRRPASSSGRRGQTAESAGTSALPTSLPRRPAGVPARVPAADTSSGGATTVTLPDTESGPPSSQRQQPQQLECTLAARMPSLAANPPADLADIHGIFAGFDAATASMVNAGAGGVAYADLCQYAAAAMAHRACLARLLPPTTSPTTPPWERRDGRETGDDADADAAAVVVVAPLGRLGSMPGVPAELRRAASTLEALRPLLWPRVLLSQRHQQDCTSAAESMPHPPPQGAAQVPPAAVLQALRTAYESVHTAAEGTCSGGRRGPLHGFALHVLLGLRAPPPDVTAVDREPSLHAFMRTSDPRRNPRRASGAVTAAVDHASAAAFVPVSSYDAAVMDGVAWVAASLLESATTTTNDDDSMRFFRAMWFATVYGRVPWSDGPAAQEHAAGSLGDVARLQREQKAALPLQTQMLKAAFPRVDASTTGVNGTLALRLWLLAAALGGGGRSSSCQAATMEAVAWAVPDGGGAFECDGTTSL